MAEIGAAWAQTHPGRRKGKNEDSVAVSQRGGYAVLADGLGGRPGGEVASSVVVAAVRHLFSLRARGFRHFDTLQKIGFEAHCLLHDIASWVPAWKGMASTIQFFCLKGDLGYLLNIGDSRCYLFREGRLWILSFDQNVESLVASSQTALRRLSVRPQLGALTACIGGGFYQQPEVSQVMLQHGDVFMLCSDGLSGELSHRQLTEIFKKNLDSGLRSVGQVLESQALRAGGRDNITLALVAIRSSQPPVSTPAVRASGAGELQLFYLDPQRQLLGPLAPMDLLHKVMREGWSAEGRVSLSDGRRGVAGELVVAALREQGRSVPELFRHYL